MAEPDPNNPKSTVSSMNTGRPKYRSATSAAIQGEYGRFNEGFDKAPGLARGLNFFQAVGRDAIVGGKNAFNLLNASWAGKSPDKLYQFGVNPYTTPTTQGVKNQPGVGYTVGPYGATPYNKDQTPYVVTPYGASVIRTQGQDLVRTGNNTYAPSYVTNNTTSASGGGGAGGARSTVDLSPYAGGVLPALDPETAFKLNQRGIIASRDAALARLSNQAALTNAYVTAANERRNLARTLTGGYADRLGLGSEYGTSMTSPAIGGMIDQDYLSKLAMAQIAENAAAATGQEKYLRDNLSSFSSLRNALLDIEAERVAKQAAMGVSETGQAAVTPVKKKKKKGTATVSSSMATQNPVAMQAE